MNTLFMLCVTKTDLTGISSSLSFQISKVSRYVHLLQTITLFTINCMKKGHVLSSTAFHRHVWSNQVK